MSNVNPGDLAYVLPRAATPGLAGRFVKVGPDAAGSKIFRAVDGRKVQGASQWAKQAWTCTPATTGSSLPWMVRVGETSLVLDMLERPIADDCLKRVDGPEGMDEMLRITGLPKAVSTGQGEKV